MRVTSWTSAVYQSDELSRRNHGSQNCFALVQVLRPPSDYIIYHIIIPHVAQHVVQLGKVTETSPLLGLG